MPKCPYCDKELKYKRTLDRHVKQFHADQATAPAEPETPLETPHSEPETTEAPSAESLSIVKPPAEQSFYCVDCGAEGIKKGQASCPKCGGAFDWSKINA